MQQQHVQQLDEAVSEVFTLMLNRECLPGRCTVAPPCPLSLLTPVTVSARAARDGLSAFISFSGSMRGACTVHLSLQTAALLTGELLGETSEESSSLTADAAGELCNMIAGSWKSRQPRNTASCALSSPLISLEALTCPPTSSHAFRHSLVRTYKFQEHCLRLELGFD